MCSFDKKYTSMCSLYCKCAPYRYNISSCTRIDWVPHLRADIQESAERLRGMTRRGCLHGRDGDVDCWEVGSLAPGVRGTMAVRVYDELRDRRSLARLVRPDGRLGLWDRLTAQATLHPGRPQVVTALVSPRYGQALFPLAIPASLVGRLFRHGANAKRHSALGRGQTRLPTSRAAMYRLFNGLPTPLPDLGHDKQCSSERPRVRHRQRKQQQWLIISCSCWESLRRGCRRGAVCSGRSRYRALGAYPCGDHWGHGGCVCHLQS
jgi:hypothetical protein